LNDRFAPILNLGAKRLGKLVNDTIQWRSDCLRFT